MSDPKPTESETPIVPSDEAPVSPVPSSSVPERHPGDGEESRKSPMAGQSSGASASSTIVGSVKPTRQPKWQADPGCMEQITAMGFSKSAAEKGLFNTGNSSADSAVLWILDHPESTTETNVEEELLEDFESGSSSDSGDEYSDSEKLKMVLVVNTELKMGKGKMIAQGAHASVGLYRLMLEKPEMNDMLVRWDMAGSMKVAVKGDSTAHLMQLYDRARQVLSLPCCLVRDAGRTQIPAGSVTVLAIFGPAALVNQVTGSLKLL